MFFTCTVALLAPWRLKTSFCRDRTSFINGNSVLDDDVVRELIVVRALMAGFPLPVLLCGNRFDEWKQIGRGMLANPGKMNFRPVLSRPVPRVGPKEFQEESLPYHEHHDDAG